MNNYIRIFMLGGAFTCGLATTASAEPVRIIQGENMVMLPLETTVPNPAAEPSDLEENMVMVPGNPMDEIYVPVTGPNYVEAGINVHNVSNNVGDWFGQFITGQYQTDEKNRWNVYLQNQKAFHDNGTFLSVGNTHTFNDRWYSQAALGVGTDTSFLPRVRGDASLSRRWLDQGNLVTTGGVSFTKASETYTGYGLFAGASYYFNGPFVLQGGVRVEMSNPGQVISNSEFIALTYGYQKSFYLTASAGIAHEAYQILNSGSINNEFNSHTFSLSWRQWLGEDWGFNLAGEYYKNPFYDRTGTIVSVFKEF
jgi:YaiO family outer membrane protein